MFGYSRFVTSYYGRNGIFPLILKSLLSDGCPGDCGDRRDNACVVPTIVATILTAMQNYYTMHMVRHYNKFTQFHIFCMVPDFVP
jgi:hypothetical protein